jgi:hypothetical protein
MLQCEHFVELPLKFAGPVLGSKYEINVYSIVAWKEKDSYVYDLQSSRLQNIPLSLLKTLGFLIDNTNMESSLREIVCTHKASGT